MVDGLIFDVQDFATHDGPGVRSLIFLKGCPLHCHWCANPEGQETHVQLMVGNFACLGCLSCAEACPLEAISTGEDGRPIFDRAICRLCEEGACIEACPESALRGVGRFTSVDELFTSIRRNTRLYRNSGGGLTLSGGEPLAQPDFVRELLKRCSSIGLSVGIETCGVFSWTAVSDFIGDFDFYFFDMKGMNDRLHREATGAGISGIHANLRRLAAIDPSKITISVPLIPGFNDDAADFSLLLDLLKELSISKMRLLPYHELGRGKYEELGLSYLLPAALRTDQGLIEHLRDMALEGHFECAVSGA